MATVYKAKCHVLNRFVAIKVLKDEFTTDEEFIRRFNVEAQSAAALTHPNIVSIYDVGHENGVYYIVMELIQGKTLKQIISEEGTLPWKWSVNIAIQIASALEVAHKNNIIHRDIKPHNIIITEDGVAKVTDFGIAKAVSNSTITAFGTTIGSVHYFSPEHAKGGFTDAKSDIYSLGVVMYEMLTGRVPFDADTPVSIALKHMQEKPVEPMKLNPSIPFSINQIIMKAMKKEPAFRYQSATEMLKDLNATLKNPEADVATPKIEETQVMGAITEDMLNEEKDKNNSNSKSGKKVTGLKKLKRDNPKAFIAIVTALCLILVPLLLLGAIFGTKAIVDKNTLKDVEIPDLTEKTLIEIEDLLTNLKLEYEVKSEEYDSKIEAGKVISQDPAYRANRKIKQGSKILVVVSKGIEKTTVPKIAGMSYDEAVKALDEKKLKYEKIEETSQKIEEGYVIRQEPAENTDAFAGDTVKVYVSKGTGIEQVGVPYLIGKTMEAATKELTDAKLKVEYAYEENKSKPEGIVLSQSIEVGALIDEGSTIILTINKIEEFKTGTVNINVKALAEKVYKKDENADVPETVEVTVTVGSDTVERRNISSDTERLTISIEGIGTVNVKIYIGGVLAKQTNMNLSSGDAVWTAE